MLDGWPLKRCGDRTCCPVLCSFTRRASRKRPHSQTAAGSGRGQVQALEAQEEVSGRLASGWSLHGARPWL